MDTLATLREVTARLRKLEARRSALILKARSEGHSLRAVGDAAGMSHVAIAKREDGHVMAPNAANR